MVKLLLKLKKPVFSLCSHPALLRCNLLLLCQCLLCLVSFHLLCLLCQFLATSVSHNLLLIKFSLRICELLLLPKLHLPDHLGLITARFSLLCVSLLSQSSKVLSLPLCLMLLLCEELALLSMCDPLVILLCLL